MVRIFSAVLLVLVVGGSALAQGSQDQNGLPSRGRQEGRGGPGSGARGGAAPRVPPQAAIDVCVGKTEGTACEVTTPEGSKSGTCVYTPDNMYFACRPDDKNMSSPPPQDGGQRRKPQAEDTGN